MTRPQADTYSYTRLRDNKGGRLLLLQGRPLDLGSDDTGSLLFDFTRLPGYLLLFSTAPGIGRVEELGESRFFLSTSTVRVRCILLTFL